MVVPPVPQLVCNALGASKIKNKALIHKQQWLHETTCPVLREDAKKGLAE
jgi:hypothetical protein